jgi:hypothetical protein
VLPGPAAVALLVLVPSVPVLPAMAFTTVELHPVIARVNAQAPSAGR